MKRLLIGGDRDGNLGVLIGRLYLGLMIMIVHGWPKITGGVSQIKDIVAGHGMPFPLVLAWAATLAEFVGGGLIAIGLATRLASFFLVINLAVAAFVIHGADPLSTREFAYVYLAMSLVFLFKGAGRWSIDAALRKS